MSFAAKFYSFSVNLNQIDRQLFTRVRVKVPLHPLESLPHFYARMVAFLNSYTPGLSFSQGLFDVSQPTIWEKDVVGDTVTWIQVGLPERRKLELALRSATTTLFQVYFYEQAQIPAFCHNLRGSKTNWVKPCTFFLIDPNFLDALAEYERSSPNWDITFVDNHIYLNCDGFELESNLIPLDIWRAFQETLEPSTKET